MALSNALRRVFLLQGRYLSRIGSVRLVGKAADDRQAQRDNLEFRQRLKDLPEGDRFGAFSDRPAVVPDAAPDEPDIEAELDSHVRLAAYGRAHDRLWYLRKMKRLIAEEKHKEAADVLYTRMLVQDRVKPTRYLYNLVMSIHRDLGEVREAKTLFNMMKSRGCRPNNLTHGLLFEACGQADDLELGRQIAAHVYENLPHADLSHAIYSSALRGFAKTQNLPMAMRALDDMLLRGRFRPSQYDLRSALEACRGDAGAGAALALQVWRRFRQITHFEFFDYHYTLLLQCLLGCGFGDAENAATSITSDGASFDYKALMTGKQAPVATAIATTDETSAVDVRIENGFDDDLILSSPVNLLSLQHPVPRRESLLSLLEMSKSATHRHLSLLGGLEGLVKTMAEDGVKINKFHVSLLYTKIPGGNPAVDNALRVIVKNLEDTDSVLMNSYLSTRTRSANEVLSEIHEKNMQPDLVTYGILSRHANTIPRIREFFDKLASAGMNANDVMCVSMFLSSGLDFNAKSYLLQMMVKHDISPSAEMIETIERNIHDVRQHVIKMERTQESPSFAIPFFSFCNQYTRWLKKVAIQPNDVHRVKDKV